MEKKQTEQTTKSSLLSVFRFLYQSLRFESIEAMIETLHNSLRMHQTEPGNAASKRDCELIAHTAFAAFQSRKKSLDFLGFDHSTDPTDPKEAAGESGWLTESFHLVGWTCRLNGITLSKLLTIAQKVVDHDLEFGSITKSIWLEQRPLQSMDHLHR